MRRKTNKRGILAVIGMVSALFAGACGGQGREQYNPANNEPETVYGPPFTSSEDYDPADNINGDVYGPPEWFSIDDPHEEPEEDVSSNFSFREDTSGNFNARDISGNLKPDLSGSDGFNPKDNIAEPVYGPPAGGADVTE